MKTFYMKIGSALILFVVIFSLMIPLHTTISLTQDNDNPLIFTLNVCDGASPFSTSNTDMPSIYECMSSLNHLPIMSSYIDFNPEFTPFVSVFRDERPPRV